jgi:hypothetical protein
MKSGGTGVTRFKEGVFFNSGSVRIETGELAVDQYVQTAGTTDPAGNAISVIIESFPTKR